MRWPWLVGLLLLRAALLVYQGEAHPQRRGGEGPPRVSEGAQGSWPSGRLGYTCCHASTCRPLGGWSTRGLMGRSDLGEGFALRCFQRFSTPNVGHAALPLAEQPPHRRFVPPGPLVLGGAPRKPPTPTTDRDRTVSRRSEPSSRTALMGEQPNPWDLLQPQDATSRHRGAKPCRRWELLGKISLLSPG